MIKGEMWGDLQKRREIFAEEKRELFAVEGEIFAVDKGIICRREGKYFQSITLHICAQHCSVH